MLEKLKASKIMFWSLELLIIATLILVGTKINFLFKPIGTMFTTMFAPIIISGFLFYCVNPVLVFMMNKGIKRIWAVTIIMVCLVGVVLLLIMSVIPNLIHQITMLTKSAPDFYKAIEKTVNQVADHPVMKNVDVEQYLKQWNVSIGNIMKSTLSGLGNGIGSFISSVAGVVMLIFTVPFILFYMLKDGDKFLPNVTRFFPESHRKEMTELLIKMSQTISKYISGQMIECLFVGVGTSIGYMIVGVNYAFLFGVIAGLSNMIPYIGPYIGLAPALFVTVFTDPVKAVLACIVVLIVQQIDGNIIYPNVIGKSLDIHPLTIIIILLVAGNIAGLLGMILGVPFYAVCKTIVEYVYDMVQLNKRIKEENTPVK